MEFVNWALSPWGENILVRISWDLFWASLVGGVLFLVAHHLQIFGHLVAVGEHPLKVLAVALMFVEQRADHRLCRFD